MRTYVLAVWEESNPIPCNAASARSTFFYSIPPPPETIYSSCSPRRGHWVEHLPWYRYTKWHYLPTYVRAAAKAHPRQRRANSQGSTPLIYQIDYNLDHGQIYHLQIDHLQILTCRYEMLCTICAVHIQPRKRVLGQADYTAPTRQPELQ